MTYEEIMELYNESSDRGMIPVCILFDESEDEKESAVDDLVETVLRYEVSQGQAAWEMVQDGYAGDVEAFISDYKGDYTVEMKDGIALVTKDNGIVYKVTDGEVEEI